MIHRCIKNLLKVVFCTDHRRSFFDDVMMHRMYHGFTICSVTRTNFRFEAESVEDISRVDLSLETLSISLFFIKNH